jgi:hypothetical protein
LAGRKTAIKNEQEPNDAYGLHWQYGPDKQSIKGRLYGMV